ncbi:MAG: beta-N-acetylhexosaminidase [Bacteroidota bacterium]|nr:beta-N-acetylhexosaminidase [Bacteroidota bacterium]
MTAFKYNIVNRSEIQRVRSYVSRMLSMWGAVGTQHREGGLVAILLICLSFTAKAQFHIIPQPNQIVARKGTLALKNGDVIAYMTDTKEIGIYLQNYLAKSYNLHLKLQYQPSAGAIFLLTDTTMSKGSYRMNVNHVKLTITGNADGVFYGVQSLLQLLPADGPLPLKVPECTITDAPRFQWRGLSMDVSRHFFTVDEVKKYIDIMAHYKLNVLHWHLTDDEGWRIQIDKYPKLTELGSKITFYEKQGKFRKLDNLVDGGGRDGFYTKDDIREVLKYAKERYVTVLPEIEMPGHSEAAIFAYPELGCQDSTGEKHRVRMLDPSENTFTFMQNVLTEVIALFPNQYIHVGGDEAEVMDWLKSPTAVALMKREGFTRPEQVQSYFIKRIEKFLQSKNKKLVGWDEILHGGLAESATVMSWEGEAGGITAARMHHPVVMTPLPYMYFDAPQANESLEPIGWNPPVPWQMVYNYEPQSKQLSSDEAKYIIGVQGNVWVEKIPNMRHLEYMMYPRALAVAETAWSLKQDKDLNRFAYKLDQQYGLFKLWDLNARLPSIEGVGDVVTNEDHYSLTLKYPLKHAKIRYSLNGKMPDSTATAVSFPVKISEPVTDSLKLSAYITWTNGNQHIMQKEFVKHVTINQTEVTATLQPGLNYTLYKTKEVNYKKLDTVAPVTTGMLAFPQQFALAPPVESVNNWVKVEGLIKIDNEGDYQLTSGFEDSPLLFVDNVVVINRDKDNYVDPQKALLHLKKGYYTFKGYYLADDTNSGQSLLQLQTAAGKLLDPSVYLYHL